MLLILAASLLLFPEQSNVDAQKHTPRKPLSKEVKKAQQELIQAAEDYRVSLEKLLVFQEADVKTAMDTLEKRTKLLREGKITDKEVEEAQYALDSARDKVKHTQREIAEADLLGKTAAQEKVIVRLKLPYSKITLLRVLKMNALPMSEIQSCVEKRGVDFVMTVGDELDFFRLGATPSLVKTITSNYGLNEISQWVRY